MDNNENMPPRVGEWCNLRSSKISFLNVAGGKTIAQICCCESFLDTLMNLLLQASVMHDIWQSSDYLELFKLLSNQNMASGLCKPASSNRIR